MHSSPIVTSAKVRNKDGKWDNVRYTILPVAQVKIFEKSVENEPEDDHVTILPSR